MIGNEAFWATPPTLPTVGYGLALAGCLSGSGGLPGGRVMCDWLAGCVWPAVWRTTWLTTWLAGGLQCAGGQRFGPPKPGRASTGPTKQPCRPIRAGFCLQTPRVFKKIWASQPWPGQAKLPSSRAGFCLQTPRFWRKIWVPEPWPDQHWPGQTAFQAHGAGFCLQTPSWVPEPMYPRPVA